MPSIRTTTAFPFGGSRLLLVLAVALLFLVALSISIKQPGSILVSAFRFTQQQQQHRYQHRPRRSLSTPIPVPSSVSSSSSWYATTQDENEDDWVTIKRKKEQEQQTWEAKIKAKNERKAAGKTPNGTNRKNNRPPPPLPSPQKETTAVKDNNNNNNDVDADTTTCAHYVSTEAVTFAEAYAAELIALSGPQFDDPRTNLGVGGLDDVIAEIKRRVWVPLAAPPSVMHELGITPVRGMILYGSSGCGKTLLARQIGQLLSKARPITVVSGPQLMDKFVGSSEKNLRELFDNPPGVYDPYRISGGKGIDKAALHVIILDEFDAMARTRGGNEGGDTSSSGSGVARDSVVNQILAKMDGVDELVVPTLVIAMTNRPTLIDPALLRPGRFEVQIEVPPPRTIAARKSVLHVHMESMQTAGRLAVKDAPTHLGYISVDEAQRATQSYDELLTYLADQCNGFSGASLAAVPRAAASRALERAVSHYSVTLNRNKNNNNNNNTDDQYNQGKQDALAMFDCVVSVDDLDCAVEDVRRSATITLQQQSLQSPNTNANANDNTNTNADDTSTDNSQQKNPNISNENDTNGFEKEAVSLNLI